MELGDTLFLVFRGKTVPFLHWYHHVTVLYFCWLGYVPTQSMVGGGDGGGDRACERTSAVRDVGC